jgi:lipoprotein-releasing system permease protein
MVMEKQGEVAILQTQGLTPRQIMAVFMVQGPAPGSSARCSAPCWAHACQPAQ